ncbi:unnamed protein product [Mytilus coruscus]|uniref:YqaJ viral recombinase domain-containing protein n=1 Tax=Mytilus coruscus TaxID=42192 RepID=A0A6J8DSS3_MYTCO|nr:unnamed protein product [Mytilus coruscus]
MSPAEKCQKLRDIVLITSYRIKDLRLLFMKQKLALSKFHKEVGDDWRSSRFVYAISSTQAQIYQVRQMVKELLDVNNSLICVGASVRKQADVFVSDMQTDCFSQDNWITLKDQSSIPEDLKTTPRFIKQRSEEWFQLREKFKVTGSSLYKALGLDLLKNQQSHFDKVISGKKSTEEFSKEVKKRMEHGTINEINATATLVSKFLPIYYPEMKYIEEGVHYVNDNDQPYFIVSPDGSLGYMDTLSSSDPVPLIGCEFKCPVATEYKTPVHYEVPKRYVTQVLSEMAAMDVKELMYLCWTEESSTVFRFSVRFPSCYEGFSRSKH